jgi:diaminopimelate epimerase
MKQPILEAAKIPTSLPGNPPLEIPMTWPDTMHNVNCLAIGVPHAVVFVRDLTDQLVFQVGPQLETHTVFPHHTNVDFARVNSRSDVKARAWGRDCGERPSSSGSACAIVVAGVLTGRTNPSLTVHMRGGDLHVTWARDTENHIYVTGPVTELSQGEWPRPVEPRP